MFRRFQFMTLCQVQSRRMHSLDLRRPLLAAVCDTTYHHASMLACRRSATLLALCCESNSRRLFTSESDRLPAGGGGTLSHSPRLRVADSASLVIDVARVPLEPSLQHPRYTVFFKNISGANLKDKASISLIRAHHRFKRL